MKGYGTNRNFLGLDRKYSSIEDAAIVIQPAPYEHTVSYGSGTRRGPRAIGPIRSNPASTTSSALAPPTSTPPVAAEVGNGDEPYAEAPCTDSTMCGEISPQDCSGAMCGDIGPQGCPAGEGDCGEIATQPCSDAAMCGDIRPQPSTGSP